MTRDTIMSSTRKMVFLSLLVALGTTLHVLEGLFPIPVPLPGVKLGLANVVTLLTLYFYGLREGLLVAGVRVVLGSLVGGMFLSPGFVLSMSGCIVSTVMMGVLLDWFRGLSLKGISVAGAISHNVAQILAAMILIQSQAVIFYLPFLLIVAVPTGMVTGYLLDVLVKQLEKRNIVHRAFGQLS